ncbi:DUF2243 domain-containing protein [Nesterenkonia natronophila]|uniref:DUF2243 domain-containing protein n=1 Tax=Nesterenkonia natronophila TaxID=2174932 RepID=A0A3A4FCN1_9MICC|nr:DUF2243 domain-containing protein [Nesterenkonia natronophila]RJN32867.1 DUF2243 domain-containing protein [Nesterenkonia natronophila]
MTQAQSQRVQQVDHRRSVWVAALLGAAIMAAVDQIVFHQILAWHHFYDRSTSDIALLSDGVLHAAELVMLVAGIFLMADLSRRQALHKASAWGGFFLGAGAFQIFDGVVNHKILRLHQIRYDVDNLLLYDLVWNLAGAALLMIGAMITWRAGRRLKKARHSHV